MSIYTEKINLYVVETEFNAPLASNPKLHLELKRGHRIVVINDTVYIENKKADKNHDNANYSQASFDTLFVELNPKIFKKA